MNLHFNDLPYFKAGEAVYFDGDCTIALNLNAILYRSGI